MAFALAPPSTPSVEIFGAFVGIDGTRYPDNWIASAAPEDLAAIHVLPIIEPTVPEGQRIVSTALVRKTGPVRVERVAVFEDIPPEPPPQTVSPLQARRALRAAGLLSAVNAEIAAADEDTQDAWEYATEIRRDNTIIAAMAAHFGLTDAQVDDLFRAAAAL